MLPVGTTLEQKRFPQATVTIIIATVVAFLWQGPLEDLFGERVRLLTYGTGNLSLIGLFTSIFLHADIFHIVFNMLFLWVFGPPVEDRVGKKLFFIYYLGAGVAANIFEVLVDVIHNPDSRTVGIGASGAVSGIMALYLYRCFYSRLKMVISPLYLPFHVNIPAAPLLLLWFFKNVFYGFLSFAKPTNIGHWAHVGGFLFGLAVGRIKRYGHEAGVEHYSGTVLEHLRDGGGWKGLNNEKDLLKLLKLTPDDPDVFLQLGQYYAAKGDDAKANEFYNSAVRKYFMRNPLIGGFAVLEYHAALGRTMGLNYHIRAAEVLAESGFAEDACKAIKPVLNDAQSGLLAEKALLLFIKLCRELSRDDEAREAAARLTKLFPGSKYAAEAARALTLKPGAIFPQRRINLPDEVAKTVDDEEVKIGKREGIIMEIFEGAMRIIVDPAFLFLWFFFLFIVFFFLPKYFFVQVITFIFAFTITTFYRTDWSSFFRNITADEEKSRREVEADSLYNQGLLAERGENYLKASELYEKMLAIYPNNIQARFNLARIYQMRLRDKNNADRQYKKLLQHAPKNHPYYNEALEAIKSLGRL